MATYSSIAHNFTPPAATTSAQVGAGANILIKEITASSDSTISFQDGSNNVVLDNTYRIYIFKFYNIHPASDFVHLTFQGNASGASGFNETIQSGMFESNNGESGGAQFQYESAGDQGNGTSFQQIIRGIGNDADQSGAGELWLYNPSDTTHITLWNCTGLSYTDDNKSRVLHTAGFFNVTSAIDEIQFKMSSGNIDSGTFQLWGIV